MGKKNKSENVQVIVRVRPINKKELEGGHTECTKLDFANNTIAVDGAGIDGRLFGFDAVYNNSFSQNDVYIQTIRPVVNTVLEGFNATIFAYGQSGSGKTHSMAGSPHDPDLQGIIPRALNHIFEHITAAQAQGKLEYTVMASYVELYNGKCRDLLVDGRNNLELKENSNKLFFVKDLSIYEVKDTIAAMKLMDAGLTRREVKSTELNADSSRSHSLFSVIVRCHDIINDRKTESKLNLVDLAGSERLSKTGASGETMQEGANINLSLTALGTVIDCLVKSKPHIPYRSSPLTMLLKDGLGGNSRCVVVGTCSPSSSNSSETVSTLRFLDRAKQIKNKPTVQMDPKDAKIAQLESEIQELKARLGIGGESEGDETSTAAKENYIQSFEKELEELKNRCEELEVANQLAAQEKEECEREIGALKQGDNRQMEELNETLAEERARLSALMEESRMKDLSAQATATELQELCDVCVRFIKSYKKDWQPDLSASIEYEDGVHQGTKTRPSVAAIAAGLNAIEPALGGEGGEGMAAMGRQGSVLNRSVSLVPDTKENTVVGDNIPSDTNKRENAGSDNEQESQQNKDFNKDIGTTTGISVINNTRNDGGHSNLVEATTAHLDAARIEKTLEDLVAAWVADNGVPGAAPSLENTLRDFTRQQSTRIINGLLEDQRQVMHAHMVQRLRQAGGPEAVVLRSELDAAELIAAYEQAVDDINRLRASQNKHMDDLLEIKSIADKRRRKCEELKDKVSTAQHRLIDLAAEHARALIEQQDQLQTAHNRKIEELATDTKKNNKKEKKKIEKIEQKIEQLQARNAELEQLYDVKVMEYETLQEQYEKEKLVSLQWMKESRSREGAAGMAAVSAADAAKEQEAERLRRVLQRNFGSAGTSSSSSLFGPSDSGSGSSLPHASPASRSPWVSRMSPSSTEGKRSTSDIASSLAGTIGSDSSGMSLGKYHSRGTTPTAGLQPSPPAPHRKQSLFARNFLEHAQNQMHQ